MSLERELADEREKNWQLQHALGMDTPWPITTVLTELIAAANHLLLEHNCDQQGYERWAMAREEAGKILTALRADSVLQELDCDRKPPR